MELSTSHRLWNSTALALIMNSLISLRSFLRCIYINAANGTVNNSTNPVHSHYLLQSSPLRLRITSKESQQFTLGCHLGPEHIMNGKYLIHA